MVNLFMARAIGVLRPEISIRFVSRGFKQIFDDH